MTIDRSLRVRAGGTKNRNVLTRAERLQKLKETERWSEGKSVLGLPKVRVIKLAIKKKKKVVAEEGAEGAAAADVAKPAAGGAKSAAAAKPAAKAAAPAKKK